MMFPKSYLEDGSDTFIPDVSIDDVSLDVAAEKGTVKSFIIFNGIYSNYYTVTGEQALC